MTEDEEKTAKPAVSATRIADLSDDDKPREKIKLHGIKSLSDSELLAVLIRDGMRGKSVLDLSKEILAGVDGSLDGLAHLTIKEMCRRFKGVGEAKAMTIAAALELGARRKEHAHEKAPLIRRAEDVYEAIKSQLENLSTEEFWVLLLSRANRIMAKVRISAGGTTATVVEPKVVLKHAIDHLASAMILVHNHPSGNLTPSPQDDTLTRKIVEAGKLFDIPVLDHLIVTDEAFYSYADEGRMGK